MYIVEWWNVNKCTFIWVFFTVGVVPLLRNNLALYKLSTMNASQLGESQITVNFAIPLMLRRTNINLAKG